MGPAVRARTPLRTETYSAVLRHTVKIVDGLNLFYSRVL